MTALGRIGYEQVMGYLPAESTRWEQAGLPIGHIEQIDVRELDRRREVPVRSRSSTFGCRASRTPASSPARGPSRWSICRRDCAARSRSANGRRRSSGYRFRIASAILARHGFSHLANVLGGMTAWQAADLATVPPVAAPAPATARLNAVGGRLDLGRSRPMARAIGPGVQGEPGSPRHLKPISTSPPGRR